MLHSLCIFKVAKCTSPFENYVIVNAQALETLSASNVARVLKVTNSCCNLTKFSVIILPALSYDFVCLDFTQDEKGEEKFSTKLSYSCVLSWQISLSSINDYCKLSLLNFL